MKLEPENREDVVALIANNFRCFGGGQSNDYNPLSQMLKDEPAQFAAGVDVKEVVDCVINLTLTYNIK
jgi:hypothetical protein